MTVFLNHQFVPADHALVSIYDRGFLYGDGLFETVRVANGQPFRWPAHFDRLSRGADFLGLPIPMPETALHATAIELVHRNALTDGLLRIQITRGPGPRGYSPRAAGPPTLVLSTHPLPSTAHTDRPPQWRLHTASFRVAPANPLARAKTCHKLLNILARAEAEAAGADEALLLDTAGAVTETAAANVFAIRGRRIQTPPIDAGVLPGVTRAVIAEIGPRLELDFAERSLSSADLLAADGVFLTLCSFGVVEASALDGHPLPSSPLVATLHAAYHAIVGAETGARGGPTAN
jgi:aminodeoxychorismate lyase